MIQSRFLAISVLVTAIAFAISPWLSQGFAGFSPDQFPVQQDFLPIQPAGWAFSIWGVIFIWIIIGSFWGAIHAPFSTEWNTMRWPLLGSLGIGMFWIAMANASPIFATLMIFAMALLAIRAMLLSGHSNPAWQVMPVALYAGWLTAATGVGIGVVLGGYGVLSSQNAALIMLCCVLIVALFVQSRRRREWAYPLAVVWALCGIVASNMLSQNWPVIIISSLGILTLTFRTIR